MSEKTDAVMPRPLKQIVKRCLKYSISFCRIGIGIWGLVLFSILGLIFFILHLTKIEDWCFKMVMRCEDIIIYV